MKIGSIAHNLNDPAVERRCLMFENGGADVAVAGFCRDAELREGISARAPMVLGQSADAALVQRAAITLKNTILNNGLKEYLADCDVILARNLEQLAIASNIVGDRPLIYECLDIHRSLIGSSMPAKAVQYLEARLLPRVDLLLTSSPAFLSRHFDHRPLSAPSYLIENKLLVDQLDEQCPAQLDADQPITIGWFGMLRCSKTLEFFTELLNRSNGRIRVRISGKPSPAELPDFEDKVAAIDGMTYSGPYTYDDLPDLYGQCHFAWTIDWFEEGQNSSWLLPNRIYEAIANGAIPIGLAPIELGRWLARNNVGLRVDSPRQAMEQLLALKPQDVAPLQEKVRQVPRRNVLADAQDCVELVDAIRRVHSR